MSGNARSFLVLGLDGACWPVLEERMAAGEMPVLSSLVAEGARGTLRSIVPCNSAAAWASFATGLNPAGHGVYEFRGSAGLDGLRRVVSARSLTAPTLWDLLNRKGYRAAVLNVPAITYPVKTIDGFMVSGMLTPRTDEGFASPDRVRQRIAELTGGKYVVDVPWRLYKNRPDAFMRHLNEVTRQRVEVLSTLLEEEDWDAGCAVLESPDRLQHCMWRYMDPAHPRHDAAETRAQAPALREQFAILDAGIGRLRRTLAPGGGLLVISDHGFQGSEWQVLLNLWLEENGYLRSEGAGGLRARLLGMDHPLVLRLRKLVSRNVSDTVRARVARRPGIDWSRTAAWCPWDHQQAVRLNLAGREPAGVVRPGDAGRLLDEIAAKLRAWRNPVTGEPVVEDVVPGREVYGREDAGVPDLVLLQRPVHRVGPPLTASRQQCGSTEWISGDHHMDGVVVGHGGPFARGRQGVRAELVDVLPTTLFALGESIPGGLDGRVAEALFDEAFLRSHAASFEAGAAAGATASQEHDITSEDEAQMTESLRNLGYLE